MKYICVGLSPCFDLTMEIDELHDDKVNRTKSETRHPAGVSLNIATALKNLQLPAQLIGIAGQDNLREYQLEMQARGIPGYLIGVPGRIRENITLLISEGAFGGKTIKINRNGPPVPGCAVDEIRGELGKRIEDGDVVIFGGKMAAGMTSEQYADMMILAGNLGGRVVVDTDSLSLHHIMHIRPWLLKPNHHELQALIGREMADDSELLAGCRALTDSGIENVLLTIGSRGLMAVTRKSAVRVPARKVTVKNTVGAGDSALAGFLRMAHDGESLYLCAQFAARMAEQTITGGFEPQESIAVIELDKDSKMPDLEKVQE